MLPVAKKDLDGVLEFLDSPEGTSGTSEPDDIVCSDVSALLPERSQFEMPTGFKRAKRQRQSEVGEGYAALTERAAGIRAMAEAAKKRVKIQKDSI
jgi:hypothetical protein